MIQQQIRQTLIQALEQLQASGELTLPEPVGEIKIETPRDTSHGDYATNLAMALAKPARLAPRKIAELLVTRLNSPLFESVDIAGPGFINFRLSWNWLRQNLEQLLNAGSQFGHQASGDGHRYLLEFVSANPTGPLHFGHGRWAVLGDSLARLMRVAGYEVATEFYINDMGAQIRNLGESLRACYYQVLQGHTLNLSLEHEEHLQAYLHEKSTDFEGKVKFYHGESIVELATQLYELEGKVPQDQEPQFFADYAKAAILKQQQQELSEFGVEFQDWFPESRLHQADAVKAALDHLKQSGHTYEQDDALWFRTTDFGDDQDRVLVKKDGSNTYFANDIAYHWNKLQRGYDRLINIWGADHHGYVARMQAAVQALGYPKEALQILLGQMVNLYRAGEKVRMSKRTGDMITFGEVFEEVGKDATRYLLMQRSADSTIDFDLELAKQQNSDNPVFYVQYAHARICSIFRTAQKVTVYPALEWENKADLNVLNTPEERALLLKLLSYPDELAFAAGIREPHRLATYAQDLAALFHQFYKQCRVLFEKPDVTPEEIEISYARLKLSAGARQVLNNLLTQIFGISAPETM